MGDVKWFIGFGFLLGMIFTTHELGLFKKIKGMHAFIARKDATWLTCHNSSKRAWSMVHP